MAGRDWITAIRLTNAVSTLQRKYRLQSTQSLWCRADMCRGARGSARGVLRCKTMLDGIGRSGFFHHHIPAVIYTRALSSSNPHGARREDGVWPRSGDTSCRCQQLSIWRVSIHGRALLLSTCDHLTMRVALPGASAACGCVWRRWWSGVAEIYPLVCHILSCQESQEQVGFASE